MNPPPVACVEMYSNTTQVGADDAAATAKHDDPIAVNHAILSKKTKKRKRDFQDANVLQLATDSMDTGHLSLNQCPICWDALESLDPRLNLMLECGHQYHVICLSRMIGA